MSSPDFVIWLECDSPVYTFEWDGAEITEAVCITCGNNQKTFFSTEEAYEDLAAMDDRNYGPSGD